MRVLTQSPLRCCCVAVCNCIHWVPPPAGPPAPVSSLHPPQAKLAGHWGVKYAAVASHAAAQGRRGLAALLLEHERVAAEQVPLLLELGESGGVYEVAVGGFKLLGAASGAASSTQNAGPGW